MITASATKVSQIDHASATAITAQAPSSFEK
jgi:hypothetical protein